MAQLCHQKKQLDALNTRVVVVSFGTLPAVQRWLQESCQSFKVLLDPDRRVYQAYGLERSYWRSRTLGTRWYYLKAWLAGKKSHGAEPGEDTSQLGGDFIVDKNGVLRLVHPSHDPTDRPAVENLLQTLRKIQENASSTGS